MEAKRRTIRALVGKLSSVSDQSRADALCELEAHDQARRRKSSADCRIGCYSLFSRDPLLFFARFTRNAAATLLNISISSREAVMSTRGVLDAISHVLSHHGSTSSASAVQSSAATLHSVLVADEYRPIIGSKRDIVYALVGIIKNLKSPPRSIKDALKAMFGIALYPLNRGTMIQLGAIPPLFALVVKDGRVGIVEDTTAVIAQIAGCEESDEAFRKVSGIGVLVNLLDSATRSSMRIKENAVSALLNLVNCGGEKVAMNVRERITRALDSIAYVSENGSAKGKSKAASLMKALLDIGSNNGNVDISRDSQV